MYYRVTGDSTQHRGVEPDIALPSAISVEEVGESSRDGALPWNRIRAADVQAARARYAPLLPELQREHDARVAGDPNFRYTLAEIARDRRDAQREVGVAQPRPSARPSARRRTQEQLARENARRQRASASRR